MKPSSTAAARALVFTPHAPNDVVVWNWPIRDEPVQSGIVLTLSCLLLTIVAAVTGNLWIVAFVATGLAMALWRIWVPVRWELGLKGIGHWVLGVRRRIAWMSVVRYETTAEGVWLYPDVSRSSLDAVFIAYAGRRDAVVRCVEYYLGTWTASGDASTQELQPSEVPAQP